MAAYLGFTCNGPYCMACGCNWWSGHYCGTGSMPSYISTASTCDNFGYAEPIREPEPVIKPELPRIDRQRAVQKFGSTRRIRPLTLSRGALPRARGNC